MLAHPVRAYIGLGANLGDAAQTLAAAVRALVTGGLGELQARSALYRSAPVDADGPDFFNAVVALDTRLSPLELLDGLQGIEHAFGRERPYRNAPRTLDLDLLQVDAQRMDHPRLQLPHPRLGERAFVLLPLLELAPHLAEPGGAPWSDRLPGVAGQVIQRLDAPWPG